MATLSTDQIITGLGLILALGVACQLLASRLRLPAIVLLLPVGFCAGNLTDEVQPDLLVGDAFGPFVSLAVAVILFDGGLGLNLSEFRGSTRRAVSRLILLGVPITWGAATAAAGPLLGLSGDAAIMLGAILIVSGPTVVAPLLSFVRPVRRLRTILTWEGTVIDPIGAIIGAVVFHAVVSQGDSQQEHVIEFLSSILVGAAGGAIGFVLLWMLATKLRPGRILFTEAVLATVVGVAAATDAVADDTGLIAAIVMGVTAANIGGFAEAERRRFFETMVQLIIAVLFISISATVTVEQLREVLVPTLALVLVLVLVVRPIVAMVGTAGTDLSRNERLFVGWLDPRGIVAASTAATFSGPLVAQGIDGAEDILPATFLVIVGTVMIYGLTAVPVARWLGVTRSARSKPLLVGGPGWVDALALAFRDAGVEVAMWAGREEDRRRIESLDLELAPGPLTDDISAAEIQLEGITMILLLTDQDDFNALASSLLRTDEGPRICRVAPRAGELGVVDPATAAPVLFDRALDGPAIAAALDAGGTIASRPVGSSGWSPGAGEHLLFVIDAAGRVEPVLEGQSLSVDAGATAIVLAHASVRTAAPATAPD